MTLSAHLTGIHPRYLFLIRWICAIIGADCKTWKAKPRKKGTAEEGAPS